MNVELTEEQSQAIKEALQEAKLIYSRQYELEIPRLKEECVRKWNNCQTLIEKLDTHKEQGI